MARSLLLQTRFTIRLQVVQSEPAELAVDLGTPYSLSNAPLVAKVQAPPWPFRDPDILAPVAPVGSDGENKGTCSDHPLAQGVKREPQDQRGPSHRPRRVLRLHAALNSNGHGVAWASLMFVRGGHEGFKT